MFWRVIGGLVIAAIGTLFVIKTEKIYENVGTIEWAERKISGGTRMFIKLIGIAVILVGFMIMTNLIGGFLMGTVGRLFV